MLVTSQLAINCQLRRKNCLQKIILFLWTKNKELAVLEGNNLVDEDVFNFFLPVLYNDICGYTSSSND